MSLGAAEIAIILVLILLLFGAKKLPDLARSVGRSARIFKSEVKEMKKDDELTEQASAPAQSDEDFWNQPENQPRPVEQPNQNQSN